MDERMEAGVLFVAGLAALEVGTHARDQFVGARRVVLDFELDVAVEFREALFAGELRTGGAQQPAQQIVLGVGIGAHRGASLDAGSSV